MRIKPAVQNFSAIRSLILLTEWSLKQEVQESFPIVLYSGYGVQQSWTIAYDCIQTVAVSADFTLILELQGLQFQTLSCWLKLSTFGIVAV